MPRSSSIAVPFAVACLGIALFSGMDAVMKHLSLAIGAYNALLWRTMAGAAIGASLLGFAGVLVIMAGQARAELGAEALLGSLSILASAALYAWNIILMRQQAQ